MNGHCTHAVGVAVTESWVGVCVGLCCGEDGWGESEVGAVEASPEDMDGGGLVVTSVAVAEGLSLSLAAGEVAVAEGATVGSVVGVAVGGD